MAKIGEIIRVLRIKRGFSQYELADRMGLSRSAIGNYERGIRVPDLDAIEAFADFFDVSVADLMGREEKDVIRKIRHTKEKQTGANISSVPDLEKAALKATELLRDYRISSGPILPMPILKATPGVFVVSFTEMASETGIDSINLEMEFGAQNQDVVIVPHEINGSQRYFVAYNQRLPFYMLQFALARELGHIVLNHTDAMPEDVRLLEALYFARYLLCPRPLIRSMQDRGAFLTVETVGNITGCYGRCLAGIRKTPGAHIPSELNHEIKAQFTEYVDRFVEYQRTIPVNRSTRAEFGSYMDNYEE